MTHLTRETLIAWRDQPTDELRAMVVPHLASCDACSAIYAELIRTRSADDAPQRFNPADFVTTGVSVPTRVDARAKGAPPAVPRGWLVPIGALAAAAVILLAVYVGRRPAPPDASTTRGGSTLAIVAPIGQVNRVNELRWNGPAAADVTYRVEILDSTGQSIFESRVTGKTTLDIPVSVQTSLIAGAQYQWLVSRLDRRGETIEVSPTEKFQVVR